MYLHRLIERNPQLLEAAIDLHQSGTIPPGTWVIDLDTIIESVKKTNRAVIVEEGWPHGGVGANLAALIQGQAFDHLDAPIERVTGADVHMPYSKRMEQAAIPHGEHIVSAALQTLEGSR